MGANNYSPLFFVHNFSLRITIFYPRIDFIIKKKCIIVSYFALMGKVCFCK